MGLGFQVSIMCFRFQVSVIECGFQVSGFGFGCQASISRVWDLGFGCWVLRVGALGFEVQVLGAKPHTPPVLRAQSPRSKLARTFYRKSIG